MLLFSTYRQCARGLLYAAALTVASLTNAEVPPRADGFLTGPAKGDPLDIVLSHIHGNKKASGLSDADLFDKVVRDQFVSKHNGVTHLYLRQRLRGIEVYNGDIAAHVAANGQIIALHDRFVRNLGQRASAAAPALSAMQAVESAAKHLGLSTPEDLVEEKTKGGPAREVVLSHGGLSKDSIPAKLMYYEDSVRGVRLVWNIVLRLKDGQHWWDMNVDAETGKVLSKVNWTANDTYQVYGLPREAPTDGGTATADSRTLVVNPYSPAATNASPYGWHDTNGVAGAEFTDTRGNNVFAQEDLDNNDTGGFRPDGGASLVFTNTLNFSLDPTNSSYQASAIVNLFYWNNECHDIHYQYGFNEASGNFQRNNYGRGGAGNDHVMADAQDGSGMNNANMSTPPDGYSPWMQMFLFNSTTPRRDGDFDNGIIIHEYGHGVSIRLTGGPGNSSCLNGTQSGGMGEGWSDWWALVFTCKTNHTRSTARGLGTYVLGQSLTGLGIRSYRYSTSMAVNPLTYGDLPTHSEVHDAGEIWCVTLWEMYWNLVDAYGFDPDLYHGTGGNNIALRLVMDGLKLQPCSPTMLNARDAILQADDIDYGGVHRALIWEAFAKRGMGYSAYDGGSDASISIIEAFDVPDNLSVRPLDSFQVSGHSGGPFSSSSKSYTLLNVGTNSLNWTVTKTANWLDLSANAGSLAAGTSNTVTVSINTNAYALTAGRYTDMVIFSNTVSQVKQTRLVALAVDADDVTELFSGDNDLDNMSLTFLPNGSYNFYSVCREAASAFPTDPAGGTVVLLQDDSYATVPLSGGARVSLYGTSYSQYHIGSNGYITFGSGDFTFTASLTNHFNKARISALFDDLDPSSGGTVSYKQLSDRAVVTYQDVRLFGTNLKNNFQIEMFFDGRLRITWLNIADTGGVAGLSRGNGMPLGFSESNLSSYPSCAGVFYVAITDPANSTTLPPFANIPISASVVNSSGTVTQVDFLQNGNLIGSDNASPYSLTWSNVPVGDYALTAIGHNSYGQTATSIVVNISVKPQNFTWLGTVDTNWDLTTPNWSGEGTVYTEGGIITFSNYGVTPSNTNVCIQPAGVTPGFVMVTNSTAKTFTFFGGNLGGDGSFVKAGTGTAVFSNYTGSLTFSGGAAINGGTLNFQSGTNGIPLATRTQSFGSGTITINNGVFRFQAAVPANGYTNIFANAFRIVNSGTIQYGATLSTNPKIIFSGPVTFATNAILNISVNGSGSTGVDTNGYEFAGTMTLNGSNDIRRTGAAQNLGVSLTGNIVNGNAVGTLILSNAATSTTSLGNRQLRIRGTNNTYSGGTIIRNDGQTNDLSFFFGSVEVASNSRLGAGNVIVEGGGFLRLLGAGNIDSNATLTLKVDPSLAVNQQTGIVWIATGITNRVQQLTMGADTFTDGLFSSSNAPAYLYGGGVIQVGASPSGLEQWRVITFGLDADNPAIAGDLMDPDGDGINNLLEYALNMPPLSNGVEGLPISGCEGDHLTLTYTRRKAPTDVMYTVEVSDEVSGGWTNVGVTEQVLSDDGTFQTVKAIDPATIADKSGRFIRLRVTRF